MVVPGYVQDLSILGGDSVNRRPPLEEWRVRQHRAIESLDPDRFTLGGQLPDGAVPVSDRVVEAHVRRATARSALEKNLLLPR